jgi:AcrR family transcriptional regulator
MADVQQVALRLMQQRGFDGVTIGQIADGAGVSPSTVYRYFGTKQALVLSGGAPDLLVAILAAAAADDPTATPADLFGRASATMLADADYDALLHRLQIVFVDGDLTAAFEHEVLRCRHEVADVLAFHRGTAKRGVRDDAVAGAALGLIVAVLDRWQRSGGKKPLLKMLNKAFASIW